jgi:hypothetical protein
MSCGTSSEKTKAGAAKATGAPVATGVPNTRRTRYCSRCGCELEDDDWKSQEYCDKCVDWLDSESQESAEIESDDEW